MTETKNTPEPSVTTDPWKAVDAALARLNGADRLMWADIDSLMDAVTAARQQHRDAFAELQQRRDDVMTLCGLLSLQAEEELEPSIMRMRDALAAQAQEIERLTLKRHDANCELRGPGGAVDRRCSCGFRALRAELAQVRSLTAVEQENARLRAALEQFADCELNDVNCASIPTAIMRAGMTARRATTHRR